MPPAFVCLERAGYFSLAVRRPGGPEASVDLAGNGWGAVEGGGSIVAVGLETGRLEVYRYEQDRLECLWTKDLSGTVYPVVGRGADPLT